MNTFKQEICEGGGGGGGEGRLKLGGGGREIPGPSPTLYETPVGHAI